MNGFYHIAPNMYISIDEQFGNFDHQIISYIFKCIDVDFSSALGLPPFTTSDCFVTYKDKNPMIRKVQNGHIIYLHVKDNYWSKWLYQFAHEYCHHLINGKMTGEIYGLAWFEETICELSSMFHLHNACHRWASQKEDRLHRFAPNHRDYLNNLLQENPQLLSATYHPGFLQLWEQTLSEPTLHRDYNNAIAARMFPLFVENPSLWKMILHFGDMRQWDSLSDLFDHLYKKADENYSHSLCRLKNILFP